MRRRGRPRVEGQLAAIAELDAAIARREIVRITRRYARMRGGRAMTCVPSTEERRRAQRYGHSTRNGGKDKVIYDSAEAAEAARRELERLPGVRPMRAYPCRYSRRGHYHLAQLD